MVGIGGTIRAVKKFNNDRFGLPKENDRILMDQMHLLLEDLQEEEKLTLNKILALYGSCAHHGTGYDHFRYALRLFRLRRDPHEQFRCTRRLFI